MNHHDSHLAEWTFSWSSHEILTFYLWKCFNEFYKLFPRQQTPWMNHQCCRKGQKHFQHVQNSRIERLAAAQVEHTQTEEGCWFHSTLVLCMCSLVSPVCPKGGQSSSGDTVTHFWDIPWTRSSLEYCALKLTWRNSNGLTKEAQWMETEKKTNPQTQVLHWPKSVVSKEFILGFKFSGEWEISRGQRLAFHQWPWMSLLVTPGNSQRTAGLQEKKNARRARTNAASGFNYTLPCLYCGFWGAGLFQC